MTFEQSVTAVLHGARTASQFREVVMKLLLGFLLVLTVSFILLPWAEAQLPFSDVLFNHTVLLVG